MLLLELGSVSAPFSSQKSPHPGLEAVLVRRLTGWLAPRGLTEPSLGILTQVGVVLGIMVTQIVGLRFATQSQWRYVLFLSAAVGVAQFIASPTIVESPVWLSSNGRPEDQKVVAQRLWGIKEFSSAVEPLLEEGLESEQQRVPDESEHRAPEQLVKVPQLFSSREFKRPLAVVCFAMLAQQISGAYF